MARRAIPPGTKEKVLAEIAGGKTPAEAAVAHGVSVSSAQKWAKDAAAPTAPPPPGAAPSLPPVEKAPEGPSLAQVVAGHPGLPFPLDIAPGSPGAPGAPPPGIPAEPPPKPMDAKALLAVVTVAKTTAVQMAAMAWRVPLSDDEVARLTEYTEAEKKSLEVLAPYAAEYTGMLDRYAKPGMALIFAGVVGISVARSIEAVRLKRSPKPRKVISETQAEAKEKRKR